MAQADVVTDWNTKAGDIVAAAKLPPHPPTARWRWCRRRCTRPSTPAPGAIRRSAEARDAAPRVSVEAAVAEANRATLSKLLPTQQAAVDSAYESALSTIPAAGQNRRTLALGKRPLPPSSRCAPTTAPARRRAIGRTRPPAPTCRPPFRRSPVAAAQAMGHGERRTRSARAAAPASRVTGGCATTTRSRPSAPGTARTGARNRRTSRASGRPPTGHLLFGRALRRQRARPRAHPQRPPPRHRGRGDGRRADRGHGCQVSPPLLAADHGHSKWRHRRQRRHGARLVVGTAHRYPHAPGVSCAHCILAGSVGAILRAEVGTAPVPTLTHHQCDRPRARHGAGTRSRTSCRKSRTRASTAGWHYRNSTEVAPTWARRSANWQSRVLSGGSSAGEPVAG